MYLSILLLFPKLNNQLLSFWIVFMYIYPRWTDYLKKPIQKLDDYVIVGKVEM